MQTAKIYELNFGGGGMREIKPEAITIGQRVYHDSRYVSGEAVVVANNGAHGCEIIFADGHSLTGQRLDCLSPFQRITIREGIADAGEVARLIELKAEKRAADRMTQEAKQNQHKLDYERFVNELRTKYPWASNNVRGYAQASKNIKKELAIAFPGVKFSVRSDSYSGGNSVDVSWTDGPTTEEVTAITDKYQDGGFDGMEDIYNHDSSAFGEAVNTVLGRAKYVMEQRSYSDGLYEAIGRELCRLQHIEYVSLNQHNLFGEHSGDDLQWYVHQLLGKTAIAAGASFVRAESAGVGAHGWDEWARLVFEALGAAKTDAPTSRPCPICKTGLVFKLAHLNSYRCNSCAFVAHEKGKPDKATISENPAKGGIEIRFTFKPEDNVLAALKSAGWRWSKFNKCWYAKATDKARAFAQELTQ